MSSLVGKLKKIKKPFKSKSDAHSLPPSLIEKLAPTNYKLNDTTENLGGSLVGKGEDSLMHELLSHMPPPIHNLDFKAIQLPNSSDEVVVDQDLMEQKLGSVSEHRSIIMHLLSQIKMGIDLTKIQFPTFILEKHSLLEMFAGYMVHPDLFINISDGPDPKTRMLNFVQWYLTLFHAGRKDKIAKKPYNSIIGETFHCSWVVNNSASTKLSGSNSNSHSPIHFRYCGEQVSHHPPVSAFYFTCPVRNMDLTASIYTKSKFHGMSVCAHMLGKIILRLGEHNDEEYHFTLPTAYARSILTIPWAELGDKVTISCPQTGYLASIHFLTKPYYGDKLHRVEGEIFSPPLAPHSDRSSSSNRGGGNLVARVNGEWNNQIRFETFGKDARTWTIDITQLPVHRKRVRPISMQQPEESQRLWEEVTKALASENLDLATEKKQELEDRQRVSEKYRLNHRLPYPVKYFTWEDNAWVFKTHLLNDKLV